LKNFKKQNIGRKKKRKERQWGLVVLDEVSGGRG
jgi:hypothetical protein